MDNNLYEVTIDNVDAEGKGVGRLDGKTVFIAGALKGEIVTTEIYKKRPRFDLGNLVEVIKPSSERVVAKCPHFGICGGCALQHMSDAAQLANKEQALVDSLRHIGKVEPQEYLSPMGGEFWHYRYRARLSVRYVAKKDAVLVGFREKGKSFVADMLQCMILPKQVSDLIPKLRELIADLSIKESLPQIEVAVGEEVCALVFRVLTLPNQDDVKKMEAFLAKNDGQKQLQIWLQPAGPDSIYPLLPNDDQRELFYYLPLQLANLQSILKMPFLPTEFTQVNPDMNKQMVNLALELLTIESTDKVADFFCGIGNFTLAIAKVAGAVMGIEGSEALVKRALENAKLNELADKASFQVMNLFKIDAESLKKLGRFDKWLIDPPRDGAIELMKAITEETAPSMIVYVSCNPATLARDAGYLVNNLGYVMTKAMVINMFPQTAHVESVAVFKHSQAGF